MRSGNMSKFGGEITLSENTISRYTLLEYTLAEGKTFVRSGKVPENNRFFRRTSLMSRYHSDQAPKVTSIPDICHKYHK